MKRRLLNMELVSSEDNAILVERNKEPFGICLVNPYAVGKRDRSDIVALAEEISKADSFIQATTCSKLQVIAEQMKFLKDQAKRVLLEAKESHDLHHAACNFQKIPGKTYYLYERESGQKYFSMLSPDEWNSQGGPPHEYRGAYHLNNDKSWIREENLVKNSQVIEDFSNIDVVPFIYDKPKQICNVENMDC